MSSNETDGTAAAQYLVALVKRCGLGQTLAWLRAEGAYQTQLAACADAVCGEVLSELGEAPGDLLEAVRRRDAAFLLSATTAMLGRLERHGRR